MVVLSYLTEFVKSVKRERARGRLSGPTGTRIDDRVHLAEPTDELQKRYILTWIALINTCIETPSRNGLVCPDLASHPRGLL